MDRGVIIIALGHPNYGNYALQLCRSIKAVDPNIHITLVHDSKSITHFSKNNFDGMIECPSEYYTTGGMSDYLKAKTFLYELSPYKKTIFIDADVIWLPQKPITQLFNEFENIIFTISNRGRQKISEAKKGFIHWADPKDIESVYGNKGWLYNLASEFIYFTKCKEIKKLFKLAQQIYIDPKIPFKKFAHKIPDELPFEIAMMKLGIDPHQSPYFPFYWEQFEKKAMPVHEMYGKYYGYSLGGNVNTKGQEQIYNNLANNYNSKFGVRGYFPAKNKQSWLTERQSL